MIYLIFFFKQKTAYEMRISDWSSDVCSSDLGDIDVNIERTRIAADAQHLQINSPVHLRIDTRGVDAGEIERGCLDLLQADETALDQAAIEIVVAVRRIFATRIEAGANHGIRSEEHTSELQYLMRTSYAVF